MGSGSPVRRTLAFNKIERSSRTTPLMNRAAPVDRISRDSLRDGFVRSSLPGRTQAGFALAVVSIFLIAALSYRSLEWRSEGARLVAHTIEVTQALDELLSTYKDAETGQRGYLLTGAQRYLDPYEAAVGALEKATARLRGLVADNPQQLERLATVTRIGADKMAELKETVELRRAGRGEDALKIVVTDRGKNAMDSLRAAVGEMKEAERSLLSVRNREWENAAAVSTGVTWGGSALLFFVIVAAAVMSSRDFQAQRKQAWLRTGENELASRMQGVEATTDLGARIAAFLGDYLEAPVGAVYFAESPGKLGQVGAYGLPDDVSARGDLAVPPAG